MASPLDDNNNNNNNNNQDEKQKDNFQEEEKVIHYLTLGDGDFSYSYDLARCLRHVHNNSSNGDDDDNRRVVRLTATSLDSYEELVSKYKDAPFLLQQLKKTAAGLGNSNGGSVEIRHGVNAIVSNPALAASVGAKESYTSPSSSSSIADADVVIFNHPHLGTEDAVRHAQFLAHFFHSAVTYWWRRPKENGNNNSSSSSNNNYANTPATTPPALYVTLVVGQWERWHGDDAAQRHGLRVLHRSPWRPVPLLSSNNKINNKHDDNTTPYFQLRRHQTGKSFAARRAPGGSEVFCLVRRSSDAGQEEDLQRYTIPPYPFGNANATNDTTMTVPEEQATKENFACTHCDKVFAEARSLRNHVRSKHRDDDDDDDKTFPTKRRSVACDECGRTFTSHQAWQAHVQAKHTAVHINVKPDWIQPTTGTDAAAGAGAGAGSPTPATTTTTCPICGHIVASPDLLQLHLQSFVPAAEPTCYSCTFCDKTFREERARRQHENFCPVRLSSSSPNNNQNDKD
eukprot:scaffold14974_cov195-Amphora_coffeaeformis.AAC.7